jgi:hypothetical protein
MPWGANWPTARLARMGAGSEFAALRDKTAGQRK